VSAEQCDGGLSAEEIKEEQRGTELRLHTCAVCGKRNLYPIRNPGGKWALEPHSPPAPRLQFMDPAD
jgi:hypothetical protein